MLECQMMRSPPCYSLAWSSYACFFTIRLGCYLNPIRCGRYNGNDLLLPPASQVFWKISFLISPNLLWSNAWLWAGVESITITCRWLLPSNMTSMFWIFVSNLYCFFPIMVCWTCNSSPLDSWRPWFNWSQENVWYYCKLSRVQFTRLKNTPLCNKVGTI